MTYSDVIDGLTYASYRANRLTFPEISPERWGLIFADVEAMERRLATERKNSATALDGATDRV